jgi:hypothetical protein
MYILFHTAGRVRPSARPWLHTGHTHTQIRGYRNINIIYTHRPIHVSFLPLGATAQGELWPPEQSASILLYIHLRQIIWFLNNFVFLWCEVVSVTPNSQPGGPEFASLSGSYPLTCPAWVTLPVAMLPPAKLSGSQEHSNPTTTIRWRHHRWGLHTYMQTKIYIQQADINVHIQEEMNARAGAHPCI